MLHDSRLYGTALCRAASGWVILFCCHGFPFLLLLRRLPAGFASAHTHHQSWGTPRYSDRLCSDRRYSDSPQSGRRVADSSQISCIDTGSTDSKHAEPNPKNQGQYSSVLEVRCNVAGGGGTPDPTRVPSTDPAPLSHLGASINAVLSMHVTAQPLPISSLFLLFLHMPKRAKDVLGRPDCRNSVCRNRVCRNSVCLPQS